ncbi:unnamed protein product [Rhizophagus irregularis]|nr:unnamed protein product [Rhizophagus irregularis]
MSSPTSKDDIRVVVSIDFGTTFSGYAYAHKFNPNEITVEDQWEGLVSFKVPTIIKYEDKSCSSIKSWGPSALAKRRNTDQSKPIELFKLYLLNEPSMKLPPLPVDYKKVITDYLKQLSKMIRENVNNTWVDLDFYSQVLIVLTIPTEYADDEIEIMRDCAYKAGLMKEKNSRFLIFITEPEAAAVNCLNASDEVKNLKPGELFMIVDCGGDLEDYFTKYPSTLRDIVKEGKEKKLLEESEWMITLQLDDVKEIYDVVAVLKGGVQFGLEVETVAKRVLKRTYGTNVVRRSQLNDPQSEMLPNGNTIVFEPLASRGDVISVNDKVVQQFRLSSLTKRVNFNIS